MNILEGAAEVEFLKVEARDALASLYGRRTVKELVLKARGNGVGK